ncbi:MAG: hypothetical protein KC994_21375 [Candidatus Omnitrophica bacterium]|nr:hypothetical protein [Candidatus Omnitrophota bacterium]
MKEPRRLRYIWVLSSGLLLLFVLGCGKDSKMEQASPVEFVPEYPTLPDDAPLQDQMDEAAALIDRELLEEQEKFYLKNFEAIHGLYTNPGGDLLVSEESMKAMADIMQSPSRVRLKIEAEKFYFRAPESANNGFDSTYQGEVHMLGESVPAQGDYSDEVKRHRVYLHAQFIYEVQKPNSFEVDRRIRIDRYIIYQKTEDDEWRRIRIEERAPGTKP